MKLLIKSTGARARQRGWALLTVMSLATCGLMVLAGVMNWSNENAARTARNNEYFATSYAAEAATEKAYSLLAEQYQNYGFALVSQNMGVYQSTVPTTADGAYWGNYRFSGGATLNQVVVTNTATAQQIVLGGVNAGLTMMANTYEIIANAQNTSSEFSIVSTVGQQFYLGTIPLFQFAIFYQNDMEIAPGAAMTVSGPVHGNGSIYMDPQNGLTFSNTVTAVGTNYMNQSPLDPSSRTFSWVKFNAYDLNGVSPLNLPVGTNTVSSNNNAGQNVYAILQTPAAGQTPNSATGTNLLYNKADMIIIISNNNNISVTSGAGINNRATTVTNWSLFLSTNGSFYDQRDSLTVNPMVLNVSNLVNWSATNNVLRPVLSSARGSGAADVQSIYIADLRSTSNSSVTTNSITGTNYSTNVATTAGYPANGTYVPPVTSTNTTPTTTSSKPANGTYLGGISTNTTTTGTNTTSTTTVSYPSAGSYVGSVTTNKSHGVTTGYTYNLITSYNYSTNYSYNLISSYTYYQITGTSYTNTIYTTNWTINSQPGIVLSNGAILPPQGLAIATPDPAYIVGNWNVKTNVGGSSDAGTSDTAYTRPSAIFADAISVLSGNWNPANSAASLSSRVATTDTVNAAFLTGNVPSDGTYYSGGVENFPRFLENWSGQTFFYNGSMVCMFASQIATAPWPGTGSVYNPPTRTWAFDNNFTNPAKQPPLTPQVLTLQRNQWVLLKPFTTSF